MRVRVRAEGAYADRASPAPRRGASTSDEREFEQRIGPARCKSCCGRSTTRIEETARPGPVRKIYQPVAPPRCG